jgi:superfamily II helicase
LSDNIGRKHYHHKGMVADVSESGVRFFAPMELKEGADLEVALSFLQAQPDHGHWSQGHLEPARPTKQAARPGF